MIKRKDFSFNLVRIKVKSERLVIQFQPDHIFMPAIPLSCTPKYSSHMMNLMKTPGYQGNASKYRDYRLDGLTRTVKGTEPPESRVTGTNACDSFDKM